MSTQTKVKWTYIPGNSKGYQWVRGRKVKTGIKLYPQMPMKFIIHMDLPYQKTCPQQILKDGYDNNDNWIPPGIHGKEGENVSL